MSSDMTRLLGTLFNGWWELFVLLVVLLLAAMVLGWANNRGLRPAERTPLVPALPFIAAYALLLMVRHVHSDRWNAIIIAVGITLAALVVARSGTRAPVLPLLLVATLLGFGLNLSAMALFLAAALVLGLGRVASK